ncbi:MAG: ATP-binding cassette domain-containing protein [Candidatus Ancillula sp.]|jgi:ABC-type multidrug transport system ATPase subunit|nr:ATP-binding cassette domain-containing protein [Candidatus Ancillula sp.]
MINISSLNFCYSKELKVFDNFDFEINDHEKILLKGINGSGKTTLLKIIGNYQTYGDLSYNLRIDGSNNEFSKIKDDVVLLLDRPELFNELSGKENIKFFSLFWKLDADYENKAYQLCKSFQIEDSLSKSVVDYSLGMRMKLFLAICLANSAKIYLLDEPFNAIDKDAQVFLSNYINKSDSSFIVASHLLPPELEIDRIVVLQGKDGGENEN